MYHQIEHYKRIFSGFNQRQRLVVIAVSIFTIGTLLDYITTYAGLSLPHVEVTNPVVVKLISFDIWGVMEAGLVTFVMLIGGYMIKRETIAFNLISSMFIVTGIFRLAAAANNLSILVQFLL